MISFRNDYAQGCHPAILEALGRENLVHADGYGDDPWTAQAIGMIRDELGCPEAQVHLLSGGTLTNLAALASLLRAHEAVISAASGHIVRHEAGAIEATGHRVILVEPEQGKVRVQALLEGLAQNAMGPHMAKARVLYLSQTTELGTVYSHEELLELKEVCRAKGLLLFVDGARMAQACAAGGPCLAQMAKLADAFWIGGTKAGGLLGEALVFPDPNLAPEFAYVQKQRGGLLAKGRLLGITFVELFREGRIYELARHANAMAQRLAQGIQDAGHTLDMPCQSNQVFACLPEAKVQRLEKHFAFHRWGVKGDELVLRLVSSWATRDDDVDRFLDVLRAFG